MKTLPTAMPGVLVFEPSVYADERGLFMETWNERDFSRLGLDVAFKQDNHSRSKRGVLRGLHFQLARPQGKLVRCVRGAVFDVAVDLRRSSPKFGLWVAVELTEENHRMLWIPPGFAHGFLVLSDVADILYKASEYYDPTSERTVLWNDSRLAIDWPTQEPPILSAKDAHGTLLRDADVFP